MPSRLLSLVLTLLLCTVFTPADGQPSDSLAALNDEFDTSDALSNWTRITDAEGWADKLKTLAVDDGTLVPEPYPSVWFYDYVVPFLFRRVEGNFMVTTQINVSSLGTPMPSTAYSLAGLLARRPRSDAPFAADSAWAKDRENYVFLVTGTTGEPGAPKIETKSAVRSRPIVKHYPRETSGWMHLRLVRLNQTIIALYRRPGSDWQIHERFYRPDLSSTLQVGLMAYGDYRISNEQLVRLCPFLVE